MVTDNASLAVIAGTEPQHQQFVRLYFRPRTPTQFRNEGIRPVGRRYCPKPGYPPAHCAVPVFFCFDAVEVLSRDHVCFSNGNMGSPHVQYGDTQEFFEAIPFDHVFHQGAFLPDQRNSIIFSRNAEVLVPDALPLDLALRMIVCRSAAERQTLLHLIPEIERARWFKQIRLGYEGLFERKWTYVESVTAVDGVVTFAFNPSAEFTGPYHIRFEYREDGRRLPSVWENASFFLKDRLSISLSSANRGEVRLTLDDSLAFAGQVSFVDIPF